MGLELVTYISDFNTSWPLSTDKRRQGDDHLRAIKLGTKNTFPNLTGAMTLTQAFLNSLPATLVANFQPVGSIIMWDIAHAAVPTGWNLCDGSVVIGYGTVPDMRDRFIVAAGSDYTNQSTGGADSRTTSDNGAHDHGAVTGGHVLITAEIPSHTHDTLTVGISGADNGNGGPPYYVETSPTENLGPHALPDVAISATGGGGAHTHSITAAVDHNHTVDVRPRYYAAVFIVKVSGYTP